MSRSLTASCVFTVLVLTACDADTPESGALLVEWTHPSTATCDSLDLVRIEARARRRETAAAAYNRRLAGYRDPPDEPAATGVWSCRATDRGGSIPLNNLDPDTYQIEVEGFDAAGKGIYLGVIQEQTVDPGETTSTTEILLSEKPVFLYAGWTLPATTARATPAIAEIQVDVIYDASTRADVVATKRVTCDLASKDACYVTETIDGVVFAGLAPNDDVSLVLTGFSATKVAVASVVEEHLLFAVGDEIDLRLLLATCPGNPPVCPPTDGAN